MLSDQSVAGATQHQQVQLLLYGQAFEAVRDRNVDIARVNIPRITDITVLNDLMLLAIDKSGSASLVILSLLMDQGATNHWSVLAKLQSSAVAERWHDRDYEKAHRAIVTGIVKKGLLPENSREKLEEAFHVIGHMVAKGRNKEVKQLLSLSGLRDIVAFPSVLQEALRVKNADITTWLTQKGVGDVAQALVFLQQHGSRYFWMREGSYELAHGALVNTLARNGIQSQTPDKEKKAALGAIQVLVKTGQNDALTSLLGHTDIQAVVAEPTLRGENPSLLRFALQVGNGVGAQEISKHLPIVDLVDGLRCLEQSSRWAWQSGSRDTAIDCLLTAIMQLSSSFPTTVQSNLKSALSYLITNEPKHQQKVASVLTHLPIVQCLNNELGDLLIDAVQWARSEVVLVLAGKGEVPKAKGDEAFSIADGRRRAYFWQRQESNLVGSFWDNRFRARISDEAFTRLKDRFESTYTILLSPAPGGLDSDWEIMSDGSSARSSVTSVATTVDDAGSIQEGKGSKPKA